MSNSPPEVIDEVAGKKRKLYSSCDTCKLRRVKCERESEDQACAKCIEKGIHCTTAGPKRKKPRTGKRIEQAKELFGDGTHNIGESSRGNLVVYHGHRPITPAPDDVAFDMRGFDSLNARHISNDNVDSRLSLAEIVSTLSSHLIEVYFSLTHYPLPLYRWKNFRDQFDKAGRRPEQMTGMGGVLAHALIAYGAYASNSPAILGPGAPALSKLDSEEANFVHWGRQRAQLCKSLLDRAVRIADEHGVFRVECNESIVILLLLEMLIDHGDVTRRRGRPFRAAALSHAQTLSEEGNTHDEYIELQGGGLGWMLYLRDSLQAAVAGREPRLRDRDVQILCGRTMTLGLPTMVEFAKALNGDILVWDPVIRIWDHVAQLTRQLAKRLAKDSPVPEGRQDPFNDNFLWELYKDLDDTKACIKLMQAHLSQFFTFKRPGHNFFKFYCRTMSLGCIFVDYLVHRGVKQELQQLNDRLEHATLVPLDDIANFGLSEYEKRRSKLMQLKHEADNRMRKCAREMAQILWAMQNSLSARTGLGIMTGVHMVYDTLPILAEILCTMPSREEGGDPDFPLETKIQEVGWLLSTYRSLGWSWADMEDPIKYLEEQHGRLVALKSGLPPPNAGLNSVSIPVSSVRSSVETSDTTPFLLPTPSSVQFGLKPELADTPSSGYSSATSGERPTTGYAAELQAQSLAEPSMQPPEAPAHVQSMLPTFIPGPSHLPPLSDPFADLYTMPIVTEYLDGTAQAGALPSPTSYEDLQQWASVFNDQVPLNWDFGPSGFTPQP
ncbi:hypothetical protein DACRYDRAFT_118673 [Dacryopinax primogenitus]|uniref:Zn(2)-C6 fungal-type domain-containing protein n=1 Tax=Dacryopinax primogenitus (strain DJM 731) TaxID=1858805 RepID=M5FRN4_DACPD|nr:uncharacterized protein DACRYDRAFT_118673 [Dacryopinax primogenitus]EJT98388.1 hypothetical protein DACRYDRAFT_118673 [Dacryopinax primogenitus]